MLPWRERATCKEAGGDGVRSVVNRTASASGSWARHLTHPVTIAAVAVLVVNDHLLKGAGVLPGWLTGKLSDVAGMFFFPVLLAALVHGLAGAMGKKPSERLVAVAAAFATGVAFTLLKTSAPFNAWLTVVWGVNVMDPTDLLAVPMVVASAAFMLREQRGLAREGAWSPRARKVGRFVAVAFAGVASMATSQPPPATARQVARDACADVVARVCERSPGRSFVVVEARGTDAATCELQVTRAVEVSDRGRVPADMLPARIEVRRGQAATFSLAFLRPVSAAERDAVSHVELGLVRWQDGTPARESFEVVDQACTSSSAPLDVAAP